MKLTVFAFVFIMSSTISSLYASVNECLSAAEDLRYITSARLGDNKASGKTMSLMLSRAQIIELCAGANSKSPIVCFSEANKVTDFKMAQLVFLCKGANDASPVDCIEELKSSTPSLRGSRVSGEDALRLCSKG